MGIWNPQAQYLRENHDLIAFQARDKGEKRSKLAFSLSIIPLNVISVFLVESGCRAPHRPQHYRPWIPQQSIFIAMESEN